MAQHRADPRRQHLGAGGDDLNAVEAIVQQPQCLVMWSGKDEALPPRPPLRTVRATHAAYGSSHWSASWRPGSIAECFAELRFLKYRFHSGSYGLASLIILTCRTMGTVSARNSGSRQRKPPLPMSVANSPCRLSSVWKYLCLIQPALFVGCRRTAHCRKSCQIWRSTDEKQDFATAWR
jgi:hypothetical protein